MTYAADLASLFHGSDDGVQRGKLSLLPSLDWICTLRVVKAGACLVNGGTLDTF
jgi:hypothetical protein